MRVGEAKGPRSWSFWHCRHFRSPWGGPEVCTDWPAGSLSTPDLPRVTPLHCHHLWPGAESGPSTGTALRGCLTGALTLLQCGPMEVGLGLRQLTVRPRLGQGSPRGQIQGRVPEPPFQQNPHSTCEGGGAIVHLYVLPEDQQGPLSPPPSGQAVTAPRPTARPRAGEGRSPAECWEVTCGCPVGLQPRV